MPRVSHCHFECCPCAIKSLLRVKRRPTSRAPNGALDDDEADVPAMSPADARSTHLDASCAVGPLIRYSGDDGRKRRLSTAFGALRFASLSVLE